MVGYGYKGTIGDHCIYNRKFSNNNFIIFLLYVDDMLIVSQDVDMIGRLKKELFKFFDTKDLRLT